MTVPRAIWNLTKTKKIKTKEIRECRIDWNKDSNTHDVLAFGFFGGAVVIFADPERDKCQEYIDNIMPHEPQRSKKGHSESKWECPEDKVTVEGITVSMMQDIGVPICPDCGAEMHLLEEAWKED